jgi:16S rRNA (cytosine1402-N4)-methyltransferase
MRMNQSAGISAKEIVNTYDERELAKIFWQYGEESRGRFIARKIVEARTTKPLETTLELANLVAGVIPNRGKSKIHPATKVFQALRIVVNDELGELEQLLDQGFDVLAPGGRMAIISFHSLEDKIIKRKFKEFSSASTPHKTIPITESELNSKYKIRGSIVKPFPIAPSEREISDNPKSRSAKLRVIEKNF